MRISILPIFLGSPLPSFREPQSPVATLWLSRQREVSESHFRLGPQVRPRSLAQHKPLHFSTPSWPHQFSLFRGFVFPFLPIPPYPYLVSSALLFSGHPSMPVAGCSTLHRIGGDFN